MTTPIQNMRMVYYSAPTGNVGDDLNPWLWPRVFGEEMFVKESDTRFLGIGSIFHDSYLRPGKKNLIFGSGVRAWRHRPKMKGFDVDIRFVRGPKSSKLVDNAPWISDPAILMPRFLDVTADRDPSKPIGLIPHFLSDAAAAEDLAKTFDLKFISPTLDPEGFIRAITSCRCILTEAMHGAILSDAFRVPWAQIKLANDRLDGATPYFKWRDWALSLGLSSDALEAPVLRSFLPRPARLRMMPDDPSQWKHRVEKALKADRWRLSSDVTLKRAQDDILAEAAKLGPLAAGVS